MNADQQNRLRANGFIIVEIDMTDEEVGSVLEICDELAFEPIFQTVGGKPNDEFRLQAEIPNVVQTQRLFQAVQFSLERVVVKWHLTQLAMLKSLPGGAPQEPHTDMDPAIVAEQFEQTGLYSVRAVVGIVPDTRLRVFPGCFGCANMAKAKIVTLGPKKMIIFRGDLAHSGVAYEKKNIRVHCSVTLAGVPSPPPNTTFPVEYVVFSCPWCKKAFDTPHKRTMHKQRCPQNPDATKVAKFHAGDQRRNTIDKTCCGKKYTLRNSYNSHMRKKHNNKKA